jgi:hypothetical protein
VRALGFAYDDADRGRRALVGRRSGVRPGDRGAVPAGVGGLAGARPGMPFGRLVSATTAARLADGERLLLHLGAVDYRADVWVGGTYLGGHEGGHIPFAFDVTEAVTPPSRRGRAGRGAADRRHPAPRQAGLAARNRTPLDTTARPGPGGRSGRAGAGAARRRARLDPDLPAGTATMDLSLLRPPLSAVTAAVAMRLGAQVLAQASVRVAGLAGTAGRATVARDPGELAADITAGRSVELR